MISRVNHNPRIGLRLYPIAASALLVVMSLLVMLVWMTGKSGFTSVIPGAATMKFNTALCFLGAGLSLWCLRDRQGSAARERIGRIAAGVVALIAAVTLIEYSTGWDLRVDQLFIADSATPAAFFPGRMSLVTAVCFLLGGFALLWIDTRLGQYLSVATGLLALLALLGYVFDFESLYRLAGFSSIAIHTASGFLLLATGTLAARPSFEIMQFLTSDLAGSRSARVQLPTALFLLILLGLLVEFLEDRGLVDAGNESIVLIVLVILVYLPITYLNARNINRAQESLRESEERYRIVSSLTSDYAYKDRVEPDGRIVPEWITESFTRITGYALEETRAPDFWLKVIHPDDAPILIRHTQKILSGQADTEMFRVVTKSGEVRWLRDFANPIWDMAEKRVVILYGAVQDVTERKQADEALEASERRFRALVENSGMLINLINREGVLIYVSPSSARVVGYTPEEMTGRKAVEFLHPDEIPDKEQPFSQLDRKPGAVLKVERRVRHKDGTWRWVEGYSTNLLDDPAVGALVFNYRDITDRKRAEERFRLVVESAPNAIVMVDGSGKITLVNLQTEKFFGYARDELIGQRVEVLVPERHHAEHAGFRTGFMRNPAARPMGAGRDLFGLRKDGSEFPVEIGLNPIETEQGMMVLASIVDITDRKRAEAELRERQERLSSIYETVADVIFHLAVGEDGRYRFTSVNPAFLSVTGLRYDQVVGKRVDEVIPEPSLTMVLGRYETAIREKRTVRWEETSDYPTGRLTGEVSVAPVFDDAGRCTHLVGSVHDVTERRRAGEQNRFLANLVASVSDAVIAVDLQQNIQSWNTGAEAMYGWKEEEVLQRPAKDILDTDFLGDTREAVTKQIMEQGYWSGEVLQLHRDGTRIPTLSSVSLYKDGKGQPAGIVAVNRDITERKRSEEALAYSEERLNAIIEQSPLSIQVFSPAGDCIRANRGWEELWGSRREQLAGYNVLTDPQVKARGILPYLQRAFAGEIVSIPPLYYDPAETGQAGKARWTKAVIYPVKDSTGRIREVVLTHEDVTDRVFAEEKIRKLNEELEERVRERTAQLENANDELEAFSYSISHDLRAPLRSIDGFSRILLEEYGPTFDEEAKRLFNVVRSEARRMGQLIDDLLALSRLGRAEVKFKSIDMSAMAEKIFEELTTPEERARIDFRIGKLPTATGDPSLIHQVWVNLIANAIKFTSKKDRAAIRVTGAKNAGENTYSVKDNGAGFELDYAGKLFGVFQRLHSEAEFEGTGVGLAIVKRVILRHGGRVWAEGEVDKGAAFHFSLPQKGAAA